MKDEVEVLDPPAPGLPGGEELPPEPPAEPAPQPNAVLVVRNREADGNITVEIATLGDVVATEVQTILELGIARYRDQIGLGKR